MTEVKLSEKLQGDYDVWGYINLEDIDAAKSLEADSEALSKTIDNLMIVNGNALAENERLKEQNEKLLRKFKRIPASVADAYNESVALREDLVLAERLLRKLVSSEENGQIWGMDTEMSYYLERDEKEYLMKVLHDVKEGEVKAE